MTDTPKEMALEMRWADGNRVQIVLVHGDKTLHADYCDPRSTISRCRAIDRLVEKFATLNREDIENELLQLARTGPPKAEPQVLSAVDPNPEAYVDEVDGAQLLDLIVDLLRRFVILPKYGTAVCALWIVHTYLFDCFEYTPRLLVNSPDKRCGKSRLMRLLHALSARPLSCENISAPALFRSIDAYRPTLFLDEADTYLSGKHANEELRGVINSGHQRDGKVLRCVGDDAEPKAFSSFAPLAIAMIGKPPGTVEDRSIPIAMRRKAGGESVERFTPGQSLRSQFTEIVQMCVRWAVDNSAALSRAQPSVPSGIDDRAADSWFALLAIADRAGGQWPQFARDVAVAVMGGRDDADSLGVQLLKDLRQVFGDAGADRMSTAGIIAELTKLEGRPWPEYRNDRPITPGQLAHLLKPFGLAPKTIRLESSSTPKGYCKVDFEEPWIRYLGPDPKAPPATSATTPHASGDKDLGRSGAATAEGPVADESGHNPLSDRACGGVAPPAGGTTGNKDSQTRNELEALISAMADELDTPGVVAPFRGEDLRQFYSDFADEAGVDAALADARSRYQQHLLGELPPLRRPAP